MAYNLPPGPNHPSNRLRLLGTSAADTFNVDGVDIPHVAPLPGYFFDLADKSGSGGYADLDSDPRPAATEVSIKYGDDQTTTNFTLLGMRAADHLALAGGAGQDRYSLTLGAGTYFTIDIEDTDQTPASDPGGANDLTIVGVKGNFVRQDKITLTDTSATFDYHLARRANLFRFAEAGFPINNLDDFRRYYRQILVGSRE